MADSGVSSWLLVLPEGLPIALGLHTHIGSPSSREGLPVYTEVVDMPLLRLSYSSFKRTLCVGMCAWAKLFRLRTKIRGGGGGGGGGGPNSSEDGNTFFSENLNILFLSSKLVVLSRSSILHRKEEGNKTKIKLIFFCLV